MSRSIVALVLLALLVAVPASARVPAMPFDDSGKSLQAVPGGTRGDIPLPFGPSGPGKSLVDALNYVVGMQADVTEDNAGNGGSDTDPDDGGWDWSSTVFQHSSSASPTNLYGETAMGLYYGYLASPSPAVLTAMQDAVGAMIANSSIRSGSDVVFLLRYGALAGDNAAIAAAKSKYDGRVLTYGSAAALATYIRDARHGQGYDDGIIPWDLGAWALAAALLDAAYPGSGYDNDSDAVAEVIFQDSFAANPGYYQPFVAGVNDGWDPAYGNADYWFYNIGLAGIITAFEAASVHSAEITQCVDRLQVNRFPSGAMGSCNGIHTDDEDWQATAVVGRALADLAPTTYAADLTAMNGWLALTQDAASGAWVYSGGTHYPQIGGEILASLAATVGVVAPVVPSGCISIGSGTMLVPVNIQRNDSAALRGFSVRITISGNLQLAGSITNGGYLPIGGFYVTNVVPGTTWVVDNAILGPSPCQTAQTGTLFTLPLQSSSPTGTGTITIETVTLRDCNNGPIQGAAGAPGLVTIDQTAPVAIANLATTQQKTGNDGDGTTKVTVNFTAPVDAADVAVYRKGFGNYPEYDDAPGAGSVPAIPTTPAAALAAGWELTAVTASGQADETTVRDFWYYVAFVSDACGNVSAVSNRSTGSLNYHLGDVAGGSGSGNNLVQTQDISALSATYGKLHGAIGYNNACDVGPTTNMTVDARPTTDNAINFEDLMMFAINFDNALKIEGSAFADESPALKMDVEMAPGGELIARLMLVGNERSTKGVHAFVAFDPAKLRLLNAAPGSVASGETFFGTIPADAGVFVDLAALGTGMSFHGSGELAVLRFTGSGEPALASADLRGLDNGQLGLASSDLTPDVVLTRPVLLGARPNPFVGQTAIDFQLDREQQVDLRVFDATGRMIRALASGQLAAGPHSIDWDGRDQQGNRVAPGVYFYGFVTDGHLTSRKLIVLQ